MPDSLLHSFASRFVHADEVCGARLQRLTTPTLPACVASRIHMKPFSESVPEEITLSRYRSPTRIAKPPFAEPSAGDQIAW